MDRSRLGRCYELAGQKMQDMNGAEGLTLVHGMIGVPEFHTPHAWLVYHDPAWVIKYDGHIAIDGQVAWEPITEEVYPVDVFSALFRAVAVNQYGMDDFVELIIKSRNWGPWEGDYWVMDGRNAKSA